MSLWEKILDERQMIQSAPILFGVVVVSTCLLLGSGMWFLLSYRFDTKIDNLESAIKTKDAQIDLLKSSISLKNEQIVPLRNIPASSSAKPPDNAPPSQHAPSASAIIQFPADVAKQPTLTSSDNLWRWNYTLSRITPNKDEKPIIASYAVFLVFDKPVDFKNILVASSKPDNLPKWSLADFSERTALIFFLGDLADQTITLKTTQQ